MRRRRQPAPAGPFTVIAAALLISPGAPRVAQAQSGAAIAPSIEIVQMFDSNVFSAPSERQADFVTQVTPMIEAEYRAMPLLFRARGSAGMERFAEHEELTSAGARHMGGVAVEYRRTSRLTVSASAEIAGTRTPSELSADTGLALPRVRASRRLAHLSIVRGIDPRTDGRLDYSVQQLHIAGGSTVRQDAITIGAARRWSARSSGHLEYRLDRYGFGASSIGATTSIAAQTVTAGVKRAMSRRMQLSFAAGPRFSNGGAAPDVAASIGVGTGGGGYAIAYGWSQTAVFGVPAPVDLQNITATVSWTPRRRTQIRATPGFFATGVDGTRATATRLDVAVDHPIARSASLHLGFGGVLQRGGLHLAAAPPDVMRHTAIVRIVVTPSLHRQ